MSEREKGKERKRERESRQSIWCIYVVSQRSHVLKQVEVIEFTAHGESVSLNKMNKRRNNKMQRIFYAHILFFLHSVSSNFNTSCMEKGYTKSDKSIQIMFKTVENYATERIF